MTLKVATATGCEGEKGPISRYEHYVESYCQKHSECVWEKIIEQEVSMSVCLKSVCLHHRYCS